MSRSWKRYLLLITVVAALLYVAWRMYQDYELTSYPQQVADSIPVPPGARLIKQREVVAKECRSGGIVRYYATNLPWDQVIAFYRGYIETSSWKPQIPDVQYISDQSPDNQKLYLLFRWMRNTDNDVDDIERQAMNSGETVYLIQISYAQDVRASVAYCKPED